MQKSKKIRILLFSIVKNLKKWILFCKPLKNYEKQGFHVSQTSKSKQKQGFIICKLSKTIKKDSMFRRLYKVKRTWIS